MINAVASSQAALREAGEHPRTAVGVNTLPRNASVEIEVVFEAK